MDSEAISPEKTSRLMWHKKDRYGNNLNKKQQQGQPPYWRLTRILNRLAISFKVREPGSPQLHVIVPDFGIVFRFNTVASMSAFKGWDVIDVNLNELEVNDEEFGENLMWLLISKGYMAYIREGESGRSGLYKNLLINQNWGLKIIDKRLELYNNEPKNKFMIERNKRLRDFSIHYILMHHPDFFDYLW